MCNRYRFTLGWTDIYEDFSQLKIPLRFPELAPNLEPRPDVRPTNVVPIVRALEAADPAAGVGLHSLRWGLVPFFQHGKPLGAWKGLNTNARSETVSELASFKRAYSARRCLVPADGFYEWTGPKGDKTKWLITVADEPWFCMAGIWEKITTPDAGEVESFTILTTAGGEDMAGTHDRQPVILPRSDWRRWLDRSAESADLYPARPTGHLRIERAPPETRPSAAG